ncbi:MAG: hypothetical protein HQM09_17630 [Candidatus Riflebacteria bacterium]|nr:hypothetical protein [Candidatus Riflebacteria bacterium]
MLSRNPGNIIEGVDRNRLRLRNDVRIEELTAEPCLLVNFLKYLPTAGVLNFLNGKNIEMGDLILGGWCNDY